MLQAKVFNRSGYFMVKQTYATRKTKENQIIPKFVAQHKYVY